MTPIHKLLSSLTRRKDPRWQKISDDRRQLLLEFQRRIGVRFKDPGLLNQSLMHRSYVHGRAAERNMSNERMEFLGDSVLGLVVNDYLYARYPERDEGDLTKIKSLVVSRQVLGKKAQDISLGKYLLLSAGEVDSGGRKRVSIIADAMEAVIGAIYLDRGLEAAGDFIRREILVGLHEITGAEEHTNYKSLLQELVQGSRKVHPVYRISAEKGPDHDKQFVVDVSISGRIYGRGAGRSKKEAEQLAARTALESLAQRDSRRGNEPEPREPDPHRGKAEHPEREPRRPRGTETNEADPHRGRNGDGHPKGPARERRGDKVRRAV